MINETRTQAAAERLGIPANTASAIGAELTGLSVKHEKRENAGLLEHEFATASSHVLKGVNELPTNHEVNGDSADGDNLIINGDKILTAQDVLDDEEMEQLNEAIAASAAHAKPEIASILSAVDQTLSPTSAHPKLPEETKPKLLSPDPKPVEQPIVRISR